MKICTACNLEKSFEDFYRNSRAPDGRASRCKDCNRDYCKNWHSENREKSRAMAKRTQSKNKDKIKLRKILRQYNLNEDDYKNLLEGANGFCQICNQEKPLHIDHCHETGEVRGMLCLQCNTALGNFKDDIFLLEKAKEYLLK